MKLKFKIKTVYGNTLYYPIDDISKVIVNCIGGTKTLDTAKIKELIRVGIEIEFESEFELGGVK